MELTKKKAIELSIELWEWLAKTGSADKEDWIKWQEYGAMARCCPLCEYAQQRGSPTGNRVNCIPCPYFKKFGNCCENSYWEWANLAMKDRPPRKTLKKYAKEFLNQLKEL